MRLRTLRTKFVLAIFGTSMLTVLLGITAIVRYEREALREALRTEADTQSQVLVRNCVAAVEFDAAADATSVLQSLAAKAEVEAAWITLSDGRVFARYEKQSLVMEERLLALPLGFSQMYYRTHWPVMHQDEVVATLHLVYNDQPLRRRVKAIWNALLWVVLLTALLSTGMAVVLSRSILKPVNSLLRTTTEVVEQEHFGVRSPVLTEDELGTLSRQFNRMLEWIESRDAELLRTREELQDNLSLLRHEQQELADAALREQELHEQLERSERMECIGVLAGGVAHDLNNIIGPLVGYPSMISETLPPDSEWVEDLAMMEEAAKKASNVIADLLTLGRRGHFETTPVDLGDIAREFLDGVVCDRALKRHPKVSCRAELGIDVRPVLASGSQLSQVIMNLMVNAIEAHDGRPGTVTVRTRTEQLDADRPGYVTIPSGSYSVLDVVDTGKGIPAHVLNRIFEPFFSQKELGKRSGSGLGLAVVYGVISDYHGYIDVQSEEDRGTTFSVWLPSTDKPLIRADAEEELLVGGSERILVIDDLEGQRQLAERTLTSLGYVVDSVASGEEAIEYLQVTSADLILLDMVMDPGIDGLETYRRILEFRPGQPCVIATGFSQTDRFHETLRLGASGSILKPYTRNKLAKLVRAVLDRRQGDPEPLPVVVST